MDDRSEGYDEIGAIFVTSPPRFEDFYDDWTITFPLLSLDNVMTLHFMSFVSATPNSQLPPNTTQTTGATLPPDS